MASQVSRPPAGGTCRTRPSFTSLGPWLVVAACLGAPPGLAGGTQDSPRTLEISEDDFREQVVRRAQVSGGVRIGLLAGELVASVHPDKLLIRIPGGAAAGRLCVQIRSANGEYRGQIERPLDGVAPGDYRLAFPTKEHGLFRARDANEMAVLAYVGASCLEGPQTILPASWSDAIAEDSFWVFVNAGRNRAAIVATSPGGETHTFPCEPARVELAVTYDQRCHVSVPRNSRHTFRIERSATLTRLPSVNLPVSW